MKIEKINDNQIRCTLNKSDLASRQIKISELAYGTDKAKSLFRDMMQQASNQFGFDAEDIPLMIEAIPVSSDCIILVITKVEDPEELDTRFSKFTPSNDENDFYSLDAQHSDMNSADEILDLFNIVQSPHANKDFVPFPKSLSSDKNKDTGKEKPNFETEKYPNLKDIEIIYSFDNLNTIIKLSGVVKELYNGENALFKAQSNNKYYLVVNKSFHLPEEFNKVCNIISEYGTKEKFSYASSAFFNEHYETILLDSALQKLSNIN